MLATHSKYQPEGSAYLRHVRAVRDKALASLRQQEIAHLPLDKLEDICSEACAAAWDAYKALLAAPCLSFADVQAKVHSLLTDGVEACHVEGIDPDELATLLRSMTGEAT